MIFMSYSDHTNTTECFMGKELASIPSGLWGIYKGMEDHFFSG